MQEGDAFELLCEPAKRPLSHEADSALVPLNVLETTNSASLFQVAISPERRWKNQPPRRLRNQLITQLREHNLQRDSASLLMGVAGFQLSSHQ